MNRIPSAFLFALLLAGCDAETAMRTAASAGAKGVKAHKEAEKARNLTPEQEHYLGRSVAARIVAMPEYKPFLHPHATSYCNRIAQALALSADRAETWSGYHVLILDNPEVNAFAAPGGFLLVTRGLLRCCRSEDEVAAVLAHEIAHVSHKHGLSAIGGNAWAKAFGAGLQDAAKTAGNGRGAELLASFHLSIEDIAGNFMNGKYSREMEKKADETAATLLARVGYDPHALVAVLTEMKARFPKSPGGFAKSHPDPEERIRSVERLLPAAPRPVPAERASRFRREMSGI